ncbi:hypothetical protein JTE90_016762 [Oedothorax gibbosus]|uniref:Scavenger receptor class B member 1 n=1 Tax=Oedothorax gibbosus TaxID=931172 RepID=A0AAV6VYR9_9ARAC|nr:hypothetical protein JTE90_016762 [Oedothorax gibbosus]
MMCSLVQKIGLLIAFGILTATIGLAVYLTFPHILDKEINKRLVLDENSETYKYWKDVPVPIYLQFYFFNITNPEEIWNQTSKPVLKEMGPYTFRESREKVNITFLQNSTVQYRQVRRWFYQPERTNGSLEDIVTTLNVPMMAAALRGKQMNDDLVYFALEEIFSQLNCSWFIRKPVRELLFEGYEDQLMQIAKAFMNLPYDKFGWFYQRNGTDDGEITAFTGHDNINALDEIYTWNNMRYVPNFEPPCNMINGSAGDLWPPVKSRNQEITLFVPDICRSLSFSFLSVIRTKGVRAYRFWADGTQLDNGEWDPNHACFCPEDICLPAGAINVSSCKFDAPAVVSYPHFLFADSVYREGVVGMEPDPEKHRMYLDIIPEMGIPVGVAARMQINIIFEGVPNITQFENVTERIYFPVLWFSETAEIGDDMVSQLQLVLNTLPLVMNGVAFFLVAVGSVLVLTAFGLSILYALRKNEPAYSSVTSEK